MESTTAIGKNRDDQIYIEKLLSERMEKIFFDEQIEWSRNTKEKPSD
mgnify:CR=1 FL=1